jgi:hypothetical protein
MAKALSKLGILRCDGVEIGSCDGLGEEPPGVTTGEVVGKGGCVCVGVGVIVGAKVDDGVGVTTTVDVEVGDGEGEENGVGVVSDGAPLSPLDDGVGVEKGEGVLLSIVFPSTSETIALTILNCGSPSKLTIHSVTSPLGPGTSP